MSRSIVSARGSRLADLLLEAMETGASRVAIGDLWARFDDVELPTGVDLKSLEAFRRAVEMLGLHIHGIPGQIILAEAEDFACDHCSSRRPFADAARMSAARRNCLAKFMSVQIGKGRASYLVSELGPCFLGIARFQTQQSLISYLRGQRLNLLKGERSGRLHLALDDAASRYVLDVLGELPKPSPFMGRRAFQNRVESIPSGTPQGDPIFSASSQRQNSLF